MNVKEMLLTCNIEQAAALHFTLQEPPICEGWEGFFLVHQSFLKEIAEIKPIPSEYVIIGSTAVSDGKEYHSIHMYSTGELRENFRRCEIWEENRLPELYTEKELTQIAPNVLGYRFPDDYDMEFMPWEELLGVEVFEDNLHTFGHDLLAALVIREMSFWCLSHECASQGQNRFWKRLEEAMQEVYTPQGASLEEVLKELKEFADVNDEETLTLGGKPIYDQEVLFGEISPEDWARACIVRYRELLRYYNCYLFSQERHA